MRRSKEMSLLKEDMRRIITGKRTYFVVMAGLLLILRPLFDIWGSWTLYSPMELLALPLAISDFTPFAVVFCVLPFAESFCEEYNSGYYHYITIRTGPKRYAAQRCISSALSGGIVMGVIMAATIAFCLVFAHHGSVSLDDLSFMTNTLWGRSGLLQVWNGNLVYLLRVFVAFLFGCVWALVGLAVSVLITNRYITLVVPFVLYQFLWFLLGESPFNPVYMFRGDSSFIPSFGFLLIYQGAIILICSAVSYLGITRRVKI